MCYLYVTWCKGIRKDLLKILNCYDHNDWSKHFGVKTRREFQERIYFLLLTKELNKQTLVPELNLLSIVTYFGNENTKIKQLVSLPTEVLHYLARYYKSDLTDRNDMLNFLTHYPDLPSIEHMREFNMKNMRILFKMHNIPFDNSLNNEQLIISFKKHMNFISRVSSSKEEKSQEIHLNYVDIFDSSSSSRLSSCSSSKIQSTKQNQDDCEETPHISDLLKVHKK
jgi:hypothetical protein